MMSEWKEKPEETGTPSSSEIEQSPEMIRRDFFRRFGGYAAGTCAGLFVLMSAGTSKVQAGSDGG
jgi:hypothetical protein